LRKMKKVMALGATPEDILEEMEEVSLGDDSMTAGIQSGVQKKEEGGTPPPRQGSLF
jgi:hypothetical protein